MARWVYSTAFIYCLSRASFSLPYFQCCPSGLASPGASSSLPCFQFRSVELAFATALQRVLHWLVRRWFLSVGQAQKRWRASDIGELSAMALSMVFAPSSQLEFFFGFHLIREGGGELARLFSSSVCWRGCAREGHYRSQPGIVVGNTHFENETSESCVSFALLHVSASMPGCGEEGRSTRPMCQTKPSATFDPCRTLGVANASRLRQHVMQKQRVVGRCLHAIVRIETVSSSQISFCTVREPLLTHAFFAAAHVRH